MCRKQNFFDYIKGTFTEGEIGFFESLLKGNLAMFLDNEGISDKVVLNEEALTWVLIDALIELKRMKDYHVPNGNNISMIRYRSFFGSYIIKRHPLYPTEGNEWLYLVNEAWACFFITSPIIGKCSILSKRAEEELDNLLGALEHHLRYRNSNPQILELFCRSLNTGSLYLAPKE